MTVQPSFFDESAEARAGASAESLLASLQDFTWHGRASAVSTHAGDATRTAIPVFTNEFWTSRQRAANSLHEISYRACFKPQLPAFFIDLLTAPGDRVYDPFAGRGTTLIETALRSRIPYGCDVNPLSTVLVLPRLAPPSLPDVMQRLNRLDLDGAVDVPEDLLTFYHPTTLSHICRLRAYLLERAASGEIDAVDEWIRMVTVNRLTGHSKGFLSVYTLPPNQAVSVESQRKINAARNQTPSYRDVKAVIMRKSAALLADVAGSSGARLRAIRPFCRFEVGSCDREFWEAESVALVVTSPPFLDIVNYASDNWLRCWFAGVDPQGVNIAHYRKLGDWEAFIHRVLAQLHRLLRRGGFVAFEVGEVRGGAVRLEESVVRCGVAAGLTPLCIVINEQTFTKTANIWGVQNNRRGTNTNRIVMFQKAST